MESKEFYVSLIVLGGIILIGVLVTVCLIFAGIALYNRLTRNKITKEIYDKKERENGQHKGGSRGKW